MKRTENPPAPFILGIDLGTNSLGWALIGLDQGNPAGLLRCGARVFDAGMEGDIASGNEESRNLKRRQMRLQRRQIARRARRQRKVFRQLQSYDLLPGGNFSKPESLQDALNNLSIDPSQSLRGSPPSARTEPSGSRSKSCPIFCAQARSMSHCRCNTSAEHFTT